MEKISYMGKKYYTSERNVQIVIPLLKTYGIRKVIASPGTTNMTFIGSIQNDPFFEIYSSVDERSAAYIACGLAVESGEPVVISCTGATASRNYMSGLTEAYYRKIPVLAITSHRGDIAIGHLLDQQIDRRSIPNDIAMESVTVPLVKDNDDAYYCRIQATKAILALTRNGGGPAHINMHTGYSSDFSVQELPVVHRIDRFTIFQDLPTITKGIHIAIFIGSHKPFSSEEIEAIDNFCAAHNAVVFCDHTSGYYGKYGVYFALIFSQMKYISPHLNIDILIHLGEISSIVPRMNVKEVWRVNEDGELRDSYRKLSKVFAMPEYIFFSSYTPDKYTPIAEFYNVCKKEYSETINMIPELPFSNIWIAQQIHDKLPQNSYLHLGINNSLRSYNFFEISDGIKGSSNVGGYGIDGGISSLLGASLANPNILHIGVFGDLAFFYDMNSLGNRHVTNNIRIMLINNGRGTEFRNYGHICSIFGDEADRYISAAGHFGNQSSELVKHYAKDLGFKYLSASNKEEFTKIMNEFVSPVISDKPLLVEIFTKTVEESEAIKILRNLRTSKQDEMKDRIVGAIKGALGTKGKKIVKKFLR